MTAFDPRDPLLVCCDDARSVLRNGDLAQFRSRSLLSYLIRVGSFGVHSHSAMIRRNGDERIDLLEMYEFAGGRARPLEACVAKAPGLIDIFRPNTDRWPELDLQGATNHMRLLTGKRYGRTGLLILAGMRVIGLRFFLHGMVYDMGDEGSCQRPPFCSHAVCEAYRVGGGVDPVPRTPDWLVTPSQLTNSLLFEYVCSLIPCSNRETP